MTKFADNPHYVQYERLLDELSGLMAEGKGDTDEADTIRDEMDAPWYKLSQEETDRLRGVSADLYMLQDEEVYEPYEGNQEQLRQALSVAYYNHDYQELLSLLRKGPKHIPPHGMASLRAMAYQELGHLDTALLFLRYALSHTTEPELDFDREGFQTQIIYLLIRLNRYNDAIAEVDTSINRLIFQDFRFTAAHALVICAEHTEAESALPLYQRAAGVIESILDDPVEQRKLSQSLLPTAYQVLGECYRNSGQSQKAEYAYSNAIRAVGVTALRARPQLQTDFLSLPVAA